jgi:GNAT superfamily N-acetyltransferase
MDKVKFFFESPLDYSLIQKTFHQTYKRSLNERAWVWRFKDNPDANQILIDYVVEGSDLASYYAVSQNTLNIAEEGTYKVVLANMTMTHPSYQGRGLFTKLASTMYDYLAQNDYVAVYGFANHNSHHGYRRYLGWQDLAVINIMKLSNESLKIRLPAKDLRYGFDIVPVSLKDIKATEKMAFATGEVFLSRKAEQLKWRLLDNPINKYYSLRITDAGELIGIVFFKQHGEDIDIMEIFFDGSINIIEYDKSAESLMTQCSNYLLKEVKGSINIWSNLFSGEHLALEKIGFMESAFNSYFGVIPLTKDSETKDILSNVKNWHYRFIDSDIF